jgi:hypothetical protein
MILVTPNVIAVKYTKFQIYLQLLVFYFVSLKIIQMIKFQ